MSIDPDNSSGVTFTSGNVLRIKQYIHRGNSCRQPQGCNNMSPFQSELLLSVKGLPANVYIKLWKTKPKHTSSEADMNFIIVLN